MGQPSVLIAAHAFPPENITGALRPARFFKYLPQHGIATRVVSARPDLAAAERVTRVPLAHPPMGARARAELLRWVQRFLLPYNDELPWVPHAVAAAERMMERGEVNTILSTFPPVATHAVGLWLKRKHGIRWVADFRDPFATNPFRTRKWFFDYDGRFERAIFESADIVVANTDGAAAHWRDLYPEAARKIHVIWNGFDPGHPFPTQPARASGPLVISHTGTLYGGRHPGLFLESLERLIAAGKLDPAALRVELVGPLEPDARAGFEGVLARMPAGMVECAGKSIPQSEANLRMASCDILLMLDMNERGHSVQVPAKLFDYARCDRPMLAFTSHGSPLERILSSSGIEHLCLYPNDSAGRIDEGILAFLGAGRRPSRANAGFWQTFDGERQCAVLAGLISGSGQPLPEPVRTSGIPA